MLKRYAPYKSIVAFLFGITVLLFYSIICFTHPTTKTYYSRFSVVFFNNFDSDTKSLVEKGCFNEEIYQTVLTSLEASEGYDFDNPVNFDNLNRYWTKADQNKPMLVVEYESTNDANLLLVKEKYSQTMAKSLSNLKINNLKYTVNNLHNYVYQNVDIVRQRATYIVLPICVMPFLVCAAWDIALFAKDASLKKKEGNKKC